MEHEQGLTLEGLRAALKTIEKIPPRPLSINFASGLDAQCALDAWQAREALNYQNHTYDFQGIPIKVNPVLPKNVMMMLYRNKMVFFNALTGKSWEIKTEQNCGVETMTPITGKFSQEEDDYIKTYYHSLGYKDIASFLERKPVGIRARAQKLGVSNPRQKSGLQDYRVL